METRQLLPLTFGVVGLWLSTLQISVIFDSVELQKSMLTLSLLFPLERFLYIQTYSPLMTPSYSTPQEAVVAQLLDSLPLRYRYRWILRNRPYPNYVYDFFIQGGLFLEYSSSKNATSKAVNWLYQKAVLVNQRFWALKYRLTPPPFTVFLFEAPRAAPKRIRKAIQNMVDFGEVASMDKIFIFLSELETFLTMEWCERDDIKPI